MHGQLCLLILVAAFCGYIFSEHLTRAGMILNAAFLWSENTLPPILHKPLIGCYKCVAGQWALWTYVINCDSFSPAWAFAAACIGVGASILFHKLLDHE